MLITMSLPPPPSLPGLFTPLCLRAHRLPSLQGAQALLLSEMGRRGSGRIEGGATEKAFRPSLGSLWRPNIDPLELEKKKPGSLYENTDPSVPSLLEPLLSPLAIDKCMVWPQVRQRATEGARNWHSSLYCLQILMFQSMNFFLLFSAHFSIKTFKRGKY